MYSAQLHLKREQASSLAQRHSQQTHRLLSRSLDLRSQLAANYHRRIDHFIYAMLNDPICVREYIQPLKIAGRASEPKKYVGPPTMSYKKTMKNWGNYEESYEENSESRGEKVIIPKKPAAIYIDLDRKTHFKGVMSKLVQHFPAASLPPVPNPRTKTASIVSTHCKSLDQFPTEGELAKETLQVCKVIPGEIRGKYLRAGGGRLTSNPLVRTEELYSRLYASQSSG